MMQNVLKERLKKILNKNTQEVNKFELENIGKMIARTVRIEEGIPAFEINAPLKFYELAINSEGDLAKWFARKIYSGSKEEVNHAKQIYQTLSKSMKKYMDQFGMDPDDLNDTCELFKEMKEVHGIPCLLNGERDSDLFSIIADGFNQVIPQEDLLEVGIKDAHQLKKLVEGEELIDKELFFASLSFSEQGTPIMKTAYRNAFVEIVDEFENEDKWKAQRFMRSFISFVTGHNAFDGSKLKLRLNKEPQEPLFSHTCAKSVDCPKLSDKEEIKRRIKAVVEVMETGYYGVDSF